MSTMLAKIRIHPGHEAEFEDVMARMYEATHVTEPDVLRYEYWRGREPGAYYCLLSFRDSLAFWRHQASAHHEGEMDAFVRCIAQLDLEVIDPVERASPLPPTREQQAPPDSLEVVLEQARRFPVAEAEWWRALRLVGTDEGAQVQQQRGTGADGFAETSKDPLRPGKSSNQ